MVEGQPAKSIFLIGAVWLRSDVAERVILRKA